MSNMRIIDTYLVYILPYIPSAMGAFLMKQYIDSSIPDALLEAARIDGASVFRMYWSIVMPIVRPAWMTLLLFSFKDYAKRYYFQRRVENLALCYVPNQFRRTGTGGECYGNHGNHDDPSHYCVHYFSAQCYGDDE